MSNLAKKNNESMRKTTAKIRQARINTLNAKTQKKQANKKTNNRVDTYAHRLKMPKYNNVKRLHH